MDRGKIRTLFASRKIFPRVQESARESTLQGLLNVSEFVPSFATFYKHTKIIGPPMLALRQLVPRKAGCSLQAAFRDHYKTCEDQNSTCIIQYSNEKYERIPMAPRKAMELAYIQLFLASMRDRNSVPRTLSTIDPASSGWLIRLAHTAEYLGFETDMTLRLRDSNADISDIRQNMEWERPKSLYSVSKTSFEEEAQLRHQRQEIYERRRQSELDPMTDEKTTVRVARDFHRLYLPTISQSLSHKLMGPALTPYGEVVLALSAFFGSLEKNESATPDPECVSEQAFGLKTDTSTFLEQGISQGDTMVYERTAPHQDSTGSSTIQFIAINSSHVFPTVSCPRTKSEISRTMDNIVSTGRKTFMVPQQLGNDSSPLQILTRDQNLEHLYRDAVRVTVFFCEEVDTEYHAGRPLKDFRLHQLTLES